MKTLSTRHRQALALRSRGHTYQDIAAKLGISRQRAHAMCRYEGESPPHIRGMPAEVKTSVQEMVAAGVPYRDVSKALGVSLGAISNLIRREP